MDNYLNEQCETTQEMNIGFNKEIKSLKKTQTEMKYEIKTSGCETKNLRGKPCQQIIRHERENLK